jgi:hypothetical protein
MPLERISPAQPPPLELQYEVQFYQALMTFFHQTVFCVKTRQIVPLEPLPSGSESSSQGLTSLYPPALFCDGADLSFLGARLVDAALACAIADGLVDPVSKVSSGLYGCDLASRELIYSPWFLTLSSCSYPSISPSLWTRICRPCYAVLLATPPARPRATPPQPPLRCQLRSSEDTRSHPCPTSRSTRTLPTRMAGLLPPPPLSLTQLLLLIHQKEASNPSSKGVLPPPLQPATRPMAYTSPITTI